MDTSPGGKWLVRKDGMGVPSWWWGYEGNQGLDAGFHQIASTPPVQS